MSIKIEIIFCYIFTYNFFLISTLHGDHKIANVEINYKGIRQLFFLLIEF